MARSSRDPEEDLRRSCELSRRLCLFDSEQWAVTALASYKRTQDNPESRKFRMPLPETPVPVFKLPLSTAFATNSGPKVTFAQSGEDVLLDPSYNRVVASIGLQRYKDAMQSARSRMDSVPELLFLCFYAKYLHISRLASQTIDLAVPHQSEQYDNDIDDLIEEMSKVLRERNRTRMTGPLLFLQGKLLRARGKREDAHGALLQSVVFEPLLIEAWLELAECVESKSDVQKVLVETGVKIPFIRHLFVGKAYVKLGLTDRAISEFALLQNQGFADNPDVLFEIGKLLTTIDPDEAVCMMEKARKFNRLRMKNVDHFSNALFIQDESVKMRLLMDDVFEAGRFTAECSIALGNFYSLLTDHETAVQSFQRALRYDPQLHHVWTLIGHEQIEMKQTELALQSYTKAIEANPKEYRAWYGMGQTLEILRAHASALYYFQKAVEFCPSDTRMLLALADTYVLVDNISDAEICYWRAYEINNDVVILVRLARLYEKIGRYGRAAELYAKYILDIQSLSEEPGEPAPPDRDDAEDIGYAYLYLSKYNLLYRLFDDAAEDAKAAEAFVVVRDEAFAMLKQITRMKREFEEDGAEGLVIDPVRLGFPLWTEPFEVEETLDAGQSSSSDTI